jgi:cell division protein FtsZ
MAVARAFDHGREPQRTPLSYREPAPTPLQPSHHQAEHAEQETAIDEVTIRPLPPRPSFFEPMHDEEPGEEHSDEPIRPFLPPRPERAGARPRMPRVEDLPMPAQNEIRASRGEAPEHHALERKRMSLLQRLAQVGLGRREEEEPAIDAHEPQAPVYEEEPQEREHRPAPERRTQEQASEYTRRPAGRPSPTTDSGSRAARGRIEDDELEIPAFLRRQAH